MNNGLLHEYHNICSFMFKNQIALEFIRLVQLYLSDDVPETENKDEHVTHDVPYTIYSQDDTCMSTFTFSVSTRGSLHYYLTLS